MKNHYRIFPMLVLQFNVFRQAAVVLALLLSMLAIPAEAQTNFQLLKSFGFPALSTGANPSTQVTLGNDGMLYGTAPFGGSNGFGVIYKMNTNGTGYQVLHSFAGAPADGRFPEGELLQASDGMLYGTTFDGGTNDQGTIFAINTDGTVYRVVHHLGISDGINPYGGLLEGREDGYLYGTTSYGGPVTVYGGTVFKVSKDGSVFNMLYNFNVSSGAEPQCGLVEGADGELYGTTITEGGFYSNGSLFKLARNGNGFQVLYSFVGNYGDGGWAQGRLVQGGDGYLYGTTKQGGNPSSGIYSYIGNGTVYRINTNGSGYQQLYLFPTAGGSGYAPIGGLHFGQDGNLYGAASSGGANNSGTLYKLTTSGSSFTLLHSLTSLEGSLPQGALVQAPDGTLFGTAYNGGLNGYGTVFRVGPDGSNVGVIHDFMPPNGGDGVHPAAPVTISGSVAYGTDSSGGSSGRGAVYKLNLDGSGYALLHNFTNGSSDGGTSAAVIKGADGYLYGTIPSGGSNGNGAVFKLSADGSAYSDLYDFGAAPADGNNPQAGLLQGRDGALYGTTQYGGSNSSGTVFKLNTDGSAYSVLYHFSGASDGSYPVCSLIQGNDGLLYGTAPSGGTNNDGTVFKLATNGATFMKIYDFKGSPDGQQPQGGLLLGQDGFLYGVSGYGGSNSSGTVFRMDTNGGGETVLYAFQGGQDLSNPQSPLVQTADGTLYGTSSSGGSNYDGGAFALNTDGSGYALLHIFAGPDGSNPQAALAVGPDGSLYGTVQYGAGLGFGGVFHLYSLPRGVTITSLHYNPPDVVLNFTGGTASQSYSILAASNLTGAAWTFLGTSIADANGLFQFTNSNVTGSPSRFYRTSRP
jgi:uncharacterized repeat protein (TIGR03803 family)